MNMFNMKKGNEKGFTLIEIVIVLAIAALVLAGILIAVQGAQRSRRDTQRKDDAGKIASYLEQSASNNNGTYPTAATVGAFNTAYITANNLVDPLGPAYTVSIVAACPAWAAPTGAVPVVVSGRQYTVCMNLEANNTVYTSAHN